MPRNRRPSEQAFVLKAGGEAVTMPWLEVTGNVPRFEQPTVFHRHEGVVVKAGDLDRGRFSDSCDVQEEQVAAAPRAFALGFEHEVVDPVARVEALRKTRAVSSEGGAAGDALTRVGERRVGGEAGGPCGAVAKVDRMVVAGVELLDGEGVFCCKAGVQTAPPTRYPSRTSSETS